LQQEGFHRVHVIGSVDELNQTAIAILSIQEDEVARAPGATGGN
jgi:hypothetical protein